MMAPRHQACCQTMHEQPTVGLIGIGLMGQAFAERLLKAGIDVLGFDVDPAKIAWLTAAGGKAAASVADVARQADPILIAVFSTDQVEEVVEQHIQPALSADASPILLCTSTCDPDRIAALGDRAGGTPHPLPRGAGVRDQRAGPPRRWRRADRRRGRLDPGGRADSRCAVRLPLPYRPGGRRRPRQARGQPDPRPQPAGARRGAGLRRAPGARPGGVPAGRARLGRLLAGHGYQGREDGRAATSRRKDACARP